GVRVPTRWDPAPVAFSCLSDGHGRLLLPGKTVGEITHATCTLTRGSAACRWGTPPARAPGSRGLRTPAHASCRCPERRCRAPPCHLCAVDGGTGGCTASCRRRRAWFRGRAPRPGRPPGYRRAARRRR